MYNDNFVFIFMFHFYIQIFFLVKYFINITSIHHRLKFFCWFQKIVYLQYIYERPFLLLRYVKSFWKYPETLPKNSILTVSIEELFMTWHYTYNFKIQSIICNLKISSYYKMYHLIPGKSKKTNYVFILRTFRFKSILKNKNYCLSITVS